ncbi:WecB/TagA/CpsF family glycosyltransferase [Roseomonas sp. CCTCC AB2023176]|uniref:WecB/TagA/CpsF family glycosyltransferase n=1 Tax=Roseomonas sp. CCTCC AB2023176 TaxID=3342640 RepID=UPI0035E1A0CE
MPAVAVPALAVEEVALLGRTPVAPVDAAKAAALIAARDPAAPFATVVTINAQILLLAEDPSTGLRAAQDAAWLRLNDSRILARLHRWAVGGDIPVAAGSDVTLRLLRDHLRPDDAVTVVGGGEGLGERLRERFGLSRVAIHDPPMGYANDPQAWDAAIRFVLDHPARLTFVATGAPRSERLLAAIARRGGATGTGLAVGSSLLFATGLTQRAPEAMQRAGLEWLHRAWTEPGRLGRRYAGDFLPLLRLAWRARREAHPSAPRGPHGGTGGP